MVNPKPNTQRFRISMATFMLVIGLGTCVFLVWHLSIKRDRLQETVYDLRIQSKKLRVDDPSKIAVIAREKLRYGDQIFDLYVPLGPKFELCIKVEDIKSSSDYENPIARVALPAGRIAIEVTEGRHSPNVVVLIDGNKVIDVKKSAGASDAGSFTSMNSYQSCTSFEADETICLVSKKLDFNAAYSVFKKDWTTWTKAECDELNAKKLGVLLWIQAVK